MRVIETRRRRDSELFAAVCEALLNRGLKVRFRAEGESMRPNILHQDAIVVTRVPTTRKIRRGEVLLTSGKDGLHAHRVICKDPASGAVLTRGDSGQHNDLPATAILGKVIAIERRGRIISLETIGTAQWHGLRTWMYRLARAAAYRVRRLRAAFAPSLIILLGLLWHAAPASGQAFTITDTPSVTTVAAGGTIVYTEVITSTNTAAITQTVTVTQTIPNTVNFVSVAVAGQDTWNCPAPAGGVLTCTDTSGASYPKNKTTTFTITVTAASGDANATSITATGTAQGGNAALVTINATNVTVQTPDISVTQTVAPNPVATGANITYTETVANAGPNSAIGATLTQSTPTNTLFQSVTPPAGWTCGTQPAVGATGSIICTDGAPFATGNAAFTVVVSVRPEALVASTIMNSVMISETGTDPNLGNNTATASVTVSGADLSMTQTVSAPAVVAGMGGAITYIETVTNNGPNAAVGATLYQQTPTNTVFTSMMPPAGWTCTAPAANATGQVICTASANVNSGVASGNFTYVVNVNAGTAAGTTIVNNADVTSQTTDPNPANNVTSTSTVVEVTGDSDLALSMTASPTPVFVNSPLAYTITLQNLGLAAGTIVTVTDTLPATLVNPTAVTSQGTCAPAAAGKIVCALGTVAYPLATPITITVSGTTPALSGTLTNAATVAETPAANDPVTTNNSATVLTVVQPLVCATPGKDGSPGALTGTVNTYYAGVGTPAAGATSLTVTTPSSGSATQIGVGDLLLVIQTQGATINSMNTSSYGDGIAGDPASGSTSLGNSGLFEFVTVTAVTVNAGTDTVTISGTGATGGLLNSYTSAVDTATQGAQTFQVIRVPQYSSATLSSTLTALPWNGTVGGVLALDVASQLTLGGTVSLDGQGFRGGGGRILTGGAGAGTDTVTLSTTNTNGSKGEGIAGTPHYIAPALGTITLTTTAVSTAQTVVEGYPNGSYARGAPGNAGGGATDADPANNDQNSGGGGGGNGGTGGIGGFGWNSAGLVGGFGGVAFPATTSALVMGGGGGAGTTNNGSYWTPATDTGSNNCGANCTGIYSSGTYGGGIVIIHAGSVFGTGTISASGQNALETENDGGGGGGAGGSILVYANSGGLSGLTATAVGGNGGTTWPEQGPGTPYPGNRHGPGGGGGGGVILATSLPGTPNVNGGIPGTTNLENDAYGAAAGQPGTIQSLLTITQTPGTQGGAYCAGADLAVTNAVTASPLTPGSNITYAQVVSNAGPMDAVNAIFSEAVPANTTFQSITPPAGWTCNSTANILATGNISCSNPDVPSGAGGTGTFTMVTQINAGTTFGTQIVDVDNITSGTNDPNLTNNTATTTVVVGSATSALLTLTKTAAAPTAPQGGNITYTITLQNFGPAAAVGATLVDTVPANTTFFSLTPAANWTCNSNANILATGNISCTLPSPPNGPFANGASATFTLMVTVSATATLGSTISNTAQANSGTPNPNPTGASATANVEVANAGTADLSVTNTDSPNPVLAGNNITYTLMVTNIGPATATGVTLTDAIPTTATVPTQTSFVSIVAPAGWTCTTPAVGAQGTVTCNYTGNSGNFVSGATATFTLVVKVNPSDQTTSTPNPPGNVVSDTATISATTSDPNSANNSATSTTVVASPTQADVAIIKTAAPEPVNQGANLTYTLQVTNSGPATAQGVSVSDPLPTQVTFTSVSTTQGTCPTQPAVGGTGTVTCNIGTLGVGGLVIITINVNAATFSSATLSSNTATVTATTADPNSTNNSSTANSTIQSPTAVQLASFAALPRVGGGVELVWHTREEIRNLGFHLYREDAQGKHRLDPSLIAGAALWLRGGQPQHGAKTYRWLDPAGSSQSSYWLEDVDLNGTRTMHGPAQVEFGAESAQAAVPQAAAESANSPLLTQMNRLVAQFTPPLERGVFTPQPKIPGPGPGEVPVSLEEIPAVKISVHSEGWYRVTQSQLAAAGFDPVAEIRDLHLFAEGLEQSMLIVGPQTEHLGPNHSIEFYGTGIDTPFSDTRVYWLVKGPWHGKRILPVTSPISGTAAPQSFLFTVVHEDHTTYFATLLNGVDNDNFFGAAVTSEPVDQDLNVVHKDANSALPVTVDVTLQGAVDQQSHRVSVAFNGNSVGEMDFSNLANATNTFTVDSTLLHDGINTVTLTALEGDNDVSVVQSIALHYPHLYVADANWLQATAPAGASLHVSGFSNARIQVFDITDPRAILQLNGAVSLENQAYGVSLALASSGTSQRTLLVFSEDQISAPDSLAHHNPTNLANPHDDDDLIIISHPDFVASLEPLVKLRASQGHDIALVTTDQVFDAFNYGERSPYAIREYLQRASTLRRKKPQAVLLVGDASLDPRNYLGLGDFDFVPTRLIETQAFKTASDDWFSDFQETGFATIPTGRLPVRTPAEAALVVSKIVNYDKGSYAGPWNQQALLIADANVEVDFTSETAAAAASLPTALSATRILADGQDPNLVRQQIFSALNNGALLVNYTGHGSVEQWSFADLLDNNSVATLDNGHQLPVFLLMDCLNGFFQDPSTLSLASSLLLAPNGGAVAVWASSGFTGAPPQASMNQALLQNLKSNPATPIGKAILGAKSAVNDPDVRRSWILFGDPSMRLQFAKTTAK